MTFSSLQDMFSSSIFRKSESPVVQTVTPYHRANAKKRFEEKPNFNMIM
jgi:hypothetical protein